MSKYDNRKFYWLQLREDFFDEDAINWLEEQPNGSSYCLFYIKLCLKSLKTNAIMIRNVGKMLVPYDNEKLAELTKTPLDIVILAMRILTEIGLVKILKNGEIYLTKVEKMIGSKSVGAFKKEQQRTLSADNCPPNVRPLSADCPPFCPPDIDIEIDKDIEIDIEREREEPLSNNKSINQNNFITPTLQQIEEFAKERGSPVSPQKFYDFYEAGNWLDGKGEPVRNWKQKFITWENREEINKEQKPKQEESQLERAAKRLGAE